MNCPACHEPLRPARRSGSNAHTMRQKCGNLARCGTIHCAAPHRRKPTVYDVVIGSLWGLCCLISLGVFMSSFTATMSSFLLQRQMISTLALVALCSQLRSIAMLIALYIGCKSLAMLRR